jgi:hypothetical protein
MENFSTLRRDITKRFGAKVRYLSVHWWNFIPCYLDVRQKGKVVTQRYWVFGLCPSSGFFLNNNEKHNVSETGSVSVLR